MSYNTKIIGKYEVIGMIGNVKLSEFDRIPNV